MRQNKQLPPLKQFPLRIAPEQINSIRAKAAELGCSASEIVRRCVDQSLKKIR